MFPLFRTRPIATPQRAPAPAPPAPPAELLRYLARVPTAALEAPRAPPSLPSAALVGGGGALPAHAQKRWGPPHWRFFHVVSCQLRSEAAFQRCRLAWIHLYLAICANLPCASCRDHAKEYNDLVVWARVQTRADLQAFYLNFHNLVNWRTLAPTYPAELLGAQYGAGDSLGAALEALRAVMLNGGTYLRQRPQLMEGMQRQLLLQNLQAFFQTYGDCFHWGPGAPPPESEP